MSVTPGKRKNQPHGDEKSASFSSALQPSESAKRRKLVKKKTPLDLCSCEFDVLWSFLKGKHADLERMCFDQIMGFVHKPSLYNGHPYYNHHARCDECELVVYACGGSGQFGFEEINCKCDALAESKKKLIRAKPGKKKDKQKNESADEKLLLICNDCLSGWHNIDPTNEESEMRCERCGEQFCQKCMPLAYTGTYGHEGPVESMCPSCAKSQDERNDWMDENPMACPCCGIEH
jgi:hypothetical protein